MKIVVAGAGAGKTTSMAQRVLERLKEVTDGKIIYVITYTNAARDRIKEKVIELNGSIPSQLFIETSHAFLLRELIFPFHHLLYEEQYIRASQIKLPDNYGFKASKIKELKENKIIHVEKVTETAKWIVSGKSNDKKVIHEKRKTVLAIVKRYLDSIFIDEAQDIDEHLVKIIEVLTHEGIYICLVGDPKQDLRGRNAFKQMILANKDCIEHMTKNYRCPIAHVKLANHYVSKEERQDPNTSEDGNLRYVFESDIDVANFIEVNNWKYVFIYKKNERFITHANDSNLNKQNLLYELKSIVKKSNINESEIDKFTYIINKWILKILSKRNNFLIFNKLEEFIDIKLSRQDKGKLGQVLDWNRENSIVDGILVNSIDSVKGLEGEKCLFILTTDLADYFFGEKTDRNKMMNYLYVALTRSKKELVILVTSEVGFKYGYDFIKNKFKELQVEGYSHDHLNDALTT